MIIKFIDLVEWYIKLNIIRLVFNLMFGWWEFIIRRLKWFDNEWFIEINFYIRWYYVNYKDVR